jgi:hypothetical protein
VGGEGRMTKPNGQDVNFSGYGGIEDLAAYLSIEYGPGWSVLSSMTIPDIDPFTQDILEPGAPNCTLVSITRVMKYHREHGFQKIASELDDIYEVVRDVGVSHGYDPGKSGILRDLFVYTPFEIDNMVHETWKRFQYLGGYGRNAYFLKWKTIMKQLGLGHPLLMNIAFGDYKGHTVTVTGYAAYVRKGSFAKRFVQVFDGWSSSIRYLDWKKLGLIPASITKIIPPVPD